MLCGGLQSQVSARLGACTRLSHFLRQILIPWEILIFSRLPVSLQEESLPGLAALLPLSLLLECYPLSLLRIPRVSKTLLAICLCTPCAAKAVTVQPPSAREAQSPPNHTRAFLKLLHSHRVAKPALLMPLCEDVCSEALLMAAGDKDGHSHTTERLLLLGSKCGQDKLSLLSLSFLSLWAGMEFTSGPSFCCRLQLLKVNRS